MLVSLFRRTRFGVTQRGCRVFTGIRCSRCHQKAVGGVSQFGDNDVVARLGVPFLTVYQFPYEMGQKAVDLLLEQVNHPETKESCEHEIIDTKLIYHEIGIRRRG